ncbi:MAG: nicotinate (nicotinamide) nucleotide adenylyltransferase [Actinomycetota bacterium]|nr:nicotinate (nicotinamide) nucleotide adenylyltransferase [Actinomycetota bacterium]MDQ3648368.1 nicotinate (nicotinamide) nucleotide adenylyltransferase [Actinomycetota bacterium]
MRVGLLGGAFNPPHVAHLVCAQEARAQLELDHVVLVTLGQAPHRTLEEDPGAEVRAELSELAARDEGGLEVSRIELERAGPSYTSATLEVWRERAPGDELVVLLGGDQAAALPSWHEPETVLSLATVAVAERGGHEAARVRDRLSGLAGAEAVEFFDMPRLDVSSTLVRERARLGRPLRHLVPDPVLEAMAVRGLYGLRAPAGAR